MTRDSNLYASKGSLVALMVLALSLLALPVQAAVDIGKVISSSGSFMAKQSDGQTRKLKRRSKIHEGDLLITGANSQAQIRFKDSSLLELKPNTEFKVDEFSFSGKADGSEKSVYSLIKGGMRTITGKIGKKDKSKYKVNTPVASIGIRGTHYGLQLCTSGSCNGDDGLFGGIYEGAIVLGNESGEHPIGADGWNWFYVPAEGGDPQRLDALPAPMAEAEPDPDATAEEGGEAGDDGTADSGLDEDTDLAVDEEVVAVETAAAPTDTTTPTGDVSDPTNDFQSTEQTTGDSTTTGNISPTATAAPKGGWLGIGFNQDHTDYGIEAVGEGLQIDGDTTITLDTVGGVGNVPVFGSIVETDASENDPCDPCTFSSGSATLKDDGGVSTGAPDNASFAANYGRWDDGYAITDNGVPETPLGSFHYLYVASEHLTSDYSEANACVAGLDCDLFTGAHFVGRFVYADGPPPTDHTGASGSVVSDPDFTHIDVDFATQEIVGLQIKVDVGGVTYHGFDSEFVLFEDPVVEQDMSFSNIIADGESIDLIGTIDDGANTYDLVGEIGLTFIGPDAEAMGAGFGMWEDEMDSTMSVAGVGLFKRCEGGVDNCGSVSTTASFAAPGTWMGVAFLNDMGGSVGKVGTAESFITDVDTALVLDTVGPVGNVPLFGAMQDLSDPMSPCDPCVIANGSATLVDTGGISTGTPDFAPFAVNWGRWDGGYIAEQSGIQANTLGSLHYLHVDPSHVSSSTDYSNASACATLDCSGGGAGIARFTYHSGPSPTDHTGATGSVNSDPNITHVDVNFFTQAIVGTQITVDVGSGQYHGLDSTSPVQVLSFSNIIAGGEQIELNGVYTPSAGPTTNLVGQMGVTFLGPDADGAGVSFSMWGDTAPSALGVSGVGVFKRCDTAITSGPGACN